MFQNIVHESFLKNYDDVSCFIDKQNKGQIDVYNVPIYQMQTNVDYNSLKQKMVLTKEFVLNFKSKEITEKTEK